MMNKEIDIPSRELESLAQSLADVFVQRRDLYPRQLDDGRYVCVRKAFKQAHLLAHLRGDLTLGTYILDEKSQARFIAFDADDEEQFASLFTVARRLAIQGAPAYLEQSRRGGHLWLFFDHLVSGSQARKFGYGLATTFGLQGIELFPKQSRLKDGPGSLIRVPFGIHRRTGQRYEFITPEGTPLAPSFIEQVRILSQPQSVPGAIFEAYRTLQPVQPVQPQNTVFEAKETANGALSERIKASITVPEFVGRYVQLSANGRGLCPFHDDRQSSFSVNAERNYWYCFAGCGGGSIIDFWMKRQGCDFKTAVRELAGMLLS